MNAVGYIIKIFLVNLWRCFVDLHQAEGAVNDEALFENEDQDFEFDESGLELAAKEGTLDTSLCECDEVYCLPNH